MMKNKFRAIALLLIVVGLMSAFTGCGSKEAESAKSTMVDIIGKAGEKVEDVVSEIKDQISDVISGLSENSAEEESASEVPAGETVETRYYFRNRKLLQQHYEKHGIEMGFDSPEEYEAAASAVITNPDALSKTEEEDGDYVYYVEETNEFAVLSTDGYIRTYFLPSSGKAYYDRQ